MYSVKSQRDLIAYKLTLDLYKEVIKSDYPDTELFKLKKALNKIAGYISRAVGECLYPKTVIYNYKKSIKWVYIADKLLKVEHKKNIVEVRKILFTLIKKLEEKMNE
ncbi:hypothetical protein PMW00_06290 [Clostridium paraputrificum]|uniref:hypothetical protein n=1 Tax=Clostridium paraputrificum TaxID=29363 RepID=UPI00232BC045|nr:hypothetical protein [Clostridium paraputrificum]MDB2102632.1 hypothetical protein [Clostridium paraputrificum]